MGSSKKHILISRANLLEYDLSTSQPDPDDDIRSYVCRWYELPLQEYFLLRVCSHKSLAAFPKRENLFDADNIPDTTCKKG
jgi:hypothetical protein